MPQSLVITEPSIAITYSPHRRPSPVPQIAQIPRDQYWNSLLPTAGADAGAGAEGRGAEGRGGRDRSGAGLALGQGEGRETGHVEASGWWRELRLIRV